MSKENSLEVKVYCLLFFYWVCHVRQSEDTNFVHECEREGRHAYV